MKLFVGYGIYHGMEENGILRSERKAAGLKQKDLATALGIVPAYMNDLELGRRPLPRHLLERLPEPIRTPIVRARIAELEKLL